MIALRRALRLGNAPQVAFAGAGGKSAALFLLAGQFGVPVLVTTSTHLSAQQTRQGDQHLVIGETSDISRMDAARLPPVTVLTGPIVEDDRALALSDEALLALSVFAHHHGLPLLIEADGARQRALKAPAEHEPAIPPFVDAVVVVAGASGLDKPLDGQVVHRPKIFGELADLQPGHAIGPQHLIKVLLHKQGGLKNIPAKARRVALLNQADTPELEGAARGMAGALLTGFDAVLVAALRQAAEVRAVYEPVAGILLAAGGSERLGKMKQLLDWKGKPFVGHIAETALAAGLRPIVVVTGAGAVKVEAALAGLDVRIVRNENWREGQSSSVRAGLAALPQGVGAAIFLVVDQPQLPWALIEALKAEHASTLAPIVAPLVDGNRSNPVLFDRTTFPDFAPLQGDVGGRAIFSKHQVSWIPWLDASLAIDVDKPEDYDRLLSQAG
ncbi:MAG: selenium cofactor biosynthesis protein YqeC [Anaerolineales bacterium]